MAKLKDGWEWWTCHCPAHNKPEPGSGGRKRVRCCNGSVLCVICWKNVVGIDEHMADMHRVPTTRRVVSTPTPVEMVV